MNTPMNPDTLPHEELLRRHHRWMRAGLPLAVACAGLLATLAAIWIAHPSIAQWEGTQRVHLEWILGVSLSAAAGITLWLVRRSSPRRAAQRIDARFQALNRLETATQYSKINDPLLRAQREETAAYLSRTPAHQRPARFPWLVLALWLLLAGHAGTWMAWERPWTRPALAAAPKPAALPTPAPMPEASIRWESPKAETKAMPIEEVPLNATADSTGGLRDLSLEMYVNGEKRLSAPVSVAELSKPGEHKVATSIYMDQLNVEPYDMVSYYLSAQRITNRKDVPATVSPVQFVEIKPFRDDIREANGKGGVSMQAAAAEIGSLKVAQLRLIKENFLLAHADIAHDALEWKEENQHVGSEQTILGKKTAEAIQLMIQAGAPPEVVDLIDQAQPLIGDAAKKIVAEQNDTALKTQGGALAKITAVEKYVRKMIVHAQADGKHQQPEVADPFAQQRDVVLKSRAQTQAGEMEVLAHEQARLADELAQNNLASDAPKPGATPDKNKITGTPIERQTQISQRAASLLNAHNFDADTTDHLEKGREAAMNSLRQLDAEDPQAAREPAALAAQELQLAAEAMNRAGDEKARQQMEVALRVMNAAAEQARSAPTKSSPQEGSQAAEKAAEQAEQTRRDLANAAQQQQETGSAAAAARMAALANALNDPKLRAQLQKLREQPADKGTAETAAHHLEEIAERMTPHPGPGGLSRAELTALIERMDRERVNLVRLANLSGGQHPPGMPGAPHLAGMPGQLAPLTPGTGQTGQTPGTSHLPGMQGAQPGKDGKTGQQGQRGQQGQGEQGSGPGSGEGTGLTSPLRMAGNRPGSAPGESEGAAGEAGQNNQTASQSRMLATDAPRANGKMDATHEQFARSLVDQINQDVEAGARNLPNSTEAEGAHEAVRSAVQALHDEPPAAYVNACNQLNEPVSTLISLLRAELQQTTREHQLMDQHVDQAPAAYRAAVADYFERLSRDYTTTPEENGQ